MNVPAAPPVVASFGGGCAHRHAKAPTGGIKSAVPGFLGILPGSFTGIGGRCGTIFEMEHVIRSSWRLLSGLQSQDTAAGPWLPPSQPRCPTLLNMARKDLSPPAGPRPSLALSFVRPTKPIRICTRPAILLGAMLALCGLITTLQAQPALAQHGFPFQPEEVRVPNLVEVASQGARPSTMFGLADATLDEAVEAVRHAKGGRGDGMTLEEVGAWLERPQGHGALFEQKVADQLQQSGRRVDFTKAGNVGTDLRVFPGEGAPMTFAQVKATANAANSAQEALLDGLAFAGKQANRTRELLDGRIAFEGYIPADQFEELVRSGSLYADGRPTETLIQGILKRASRQSTDTGETASRLRGALKDADKLLRKMKVRPGPVTYGELLQSTRAAAGAVRAAVGRLGAAAAARPVRDVARMLSPAWAAAGKTLRFVPIIATPIQAWQGVTDLKEGRLLEGSANLAGSGLSAGAEVAVLSGRVVLSGSLVAAAALIDGGVDIYRGVTQTNTDRIVIGVVKCAAAGTMAAGLATGQPVIVVAGTVVYVGIIVADTAMAAHEAEKQGVITADQLYFSRTAPLTLTPDRYKGIGLTPAEEKAIGACP